MDHLGATRRRKHAALILSALVGTLAVGSLAQAATSRAIHAAAATPRALQAAAAAPSQSSGPLSASVDVSPFFPNGDGMRDRTTLTVALTEPASLSVVVRGYDGKTIRRLATGVAENAGQSHWSWDGTNTKHKLVADGAYVLRATATTGDQTYNVDTWVAKDKLIPYPVDPQAVVVVLDAGHGKPDSGAYYQKVREADMNLDIALRLQHMLESAGIQVVMTRTADLAINTPPVDVGGDGKVTHQDELIARNDIANLARADLHVVLMNNAYGCHCAHGTETYTNGDRTWTPEGVDLARYIQAAHIKRLKPFASKAWQPNDRGVRLWDYASMRPYKKVVMPRPDLMPSVLVELLFMDHPNELKELTTPAVRNALATAYFDGIVTWLAKRAFGLRYDVLSAPTTVQTGSTADYGMQLTNRGNTASSGWILEARMVSQVPGQPYDGSPVRGTLIAQTPIPDGLAPGASVNVALDGVPVPSVAGNWLVKFDVRLPSGGTLQDHGVVGPQLALATTDPAPPANPSPEPTPSAAPADSPSITPDSAMTTPIDDPGLESAAVPADAALGPNSSETIAVPPSLFDRHLPYDPEQGRPGAGGTFIWGTGQTWRRYITPIDIPPDSAWGQGGLDSVGR